MRSRRSSSVRTALRTAAAACAVLLVGACGSGSGGAGGGAQAAAPVAATAPSTDRTVPVRVGYFPHLTHAPGLVADCEGFL